MEGAEVWSIGVVIVSFRWGLRKREKGEGVDMKV